MELSLGVQFSTLGQSLLLGLACGVLLEVIRLWKFFKHTPFWQFCQDFIFCICVSSAALWFFQTRCDGQIRWFHGMMLVLGLWGYHKTLGTLLYRPAVMGIQKTGRLLASLFHWIMCPLIRIGKWVGVLFSKIYKFIKNILKKPFIFLKQCIIINLCLKFKNRKTFQKRGKPKVEKASRPIDREENIARFFH